jgi:hypothetical protein
MIKTRFILVMIILIGLSACAQQLPTSSAPTTPNGISGTVTGVSTPTVPTDTEVPATVTSTPFASSGIEGQVTKGPTCPGPIRIGATECQDQPYQANITILDENNNQIAQFQTDSVGYFKINLDPGSYILHPESGNPLPRAADQTVLVTDGQFTQVSIIFDTGMR